jgi:integrase
VDLADEVYDILSRRRKVYTESTLANPDLNPSGYIFESLSSGVLDYNLFRHFFNRLQASAGVRHRTIHDIRHSYASIMLSNGAPPLYVAHQMGHRSPDVTLRIYSKWMPSGERSHANLINKKPHQNHITDEKEVTNEKSVL